MADGRLLQGRVRSLSDAESGELRLIQGRVRVIAGLPADFSRTTQASVRALADGTNNDVQMAQSRVRALTGTGNDAFVAQGRVRVLYKGRIDYPLVRAWTFTLDGHDFYVLRLGNQSTLLYDTHTEQFHVWGTGDGTVWRAYDGINWLDGYRQASGYGSNVVVGDDGNGSIYFLDPEADQDDDALLGEELKRTFKRQVHGQVAIRGYDDYPCFGIQLLGSIGQQSGANSDHTVTLSYSDDRGISYVDAGTYTIDPSNYSDRLFWRSLGRIRVPGRIFRVTDYGALRRIDSLDMSGDNEQEG